MVGGGGAGNGAPPRASSLPPRPEPVATWRGILAARVDGAGRRALHAHGATAEALLRCPAGVMRTLSSAAIWRRNRPRTRPTNGASMPPSPRSHLTRSSIAAPPERANENPTLAPRRFSVRAVMAASAAPLLVVLAACTGAADSTDATTASSHRRIFVTDATWPGYFGRGAGGRDQSPTDAADALCRTAAEGAGLGGSWRAWLSSGGTAFANAADRIADTGPWYLMGTDTLVFNNKANLLNTPLAPIEINEHGVALLEGRVWTGSQVGGQLADDCNAWRSGSEYRATAGDLSATGTAWTNAGVSDCDSVDAHLYCLEQ